MSKWWEERAHRGIIGLGPPPWDDDSESAYGEGEWPTQGYDGDLRDYLPPGEDAPDEAWQQPRSTGLTREQWDELADEMIARWQAWKVYLASLPDVHFQGK